jgi:hypothetical protein
MPASNLNRIRDPLAEKFWLDELPSIAPWIYEEVTTIGIEDIKRTIAGFGESPDEPQLMTTWVSAINRNHSDLWKALASG